MPLMNTTQLKNARTNKWFPELFSGEGIETWQIFLVALVVITLSALLWFFLQFIGVGLALASGWIAAMITNRMNTHHQTARDYLYGRVRGKLVWTTVLNDARVPTPKADHEKFDLEIAEFPASPDRETYD
jgi:hypothetical protein